MRLKNNYMLKHLIYKQACKVGYFGPACQDQCPDSYFGENCVSKCNCTGKACHHIYGSRPIQGRSMYKFSHVLIHVHVPKI